MRAFTAPAGDDTSVVVNRGGRRFVCTDVAVIDLITVGRRQEG